MGAPPPPVPPQRKGWPVGQFGGHAEGNGTNGCHNGATDAAKQFQSQPDGKPRFACILAVTKNRRGNEFGANGYCIAALDIEKDGASRLVRIVPNIGTFWLEDFLPKEVKKMQRGGLLGTIRYEVGVLPDTVAYPHRGEDVVANKLEFSGPVSDDSDLLQRLADLA